MDHRVQHGRHRWEDGLKVSSLVPIINWMALFSILPISLLIVPCESIAEETPADPSLSPDPSEPLYLAGEKVVLTCSTPNTILEGWRSYEFSHIRQNKNESFIKVLDWPEGNNSLVLTATREDSGLYKCQYREQKYGRIIPSKWSRPVPIVVRDPLPPPVLKLHPSSGSLGEGKILSILCLSNDSNNNKSFHFSQDGMEMNYSHEEPLKSSRHYGFLALNATVAFQYAKDNKSLRFACRYEENITGRWMMSPWSQTLNITVEQVWIQDSDFIWSYARMGIPIIILLVPFAFYCWTKKSISQSEEKSQLADKKEEGGDLGMTEPQAATTATPSAINDSEATYTSIQDFVTQSSPGPRRKNLLTKEKTGETLYSNPVSQLKKKEQSHP